MTNGVALARPAHAGAGPRPSTRREADDTGGTEVTARRIAGCMLLVVALAACGVPQQYTTVTVAPWNPVSAPWNSTLWGIASHYKVTGGYQALAQINGISNPSLIRPGQQIRVPP
jgi:LysM repeat protein